MVAALPSELSQYIFSFLDPQSVCKAGEVCKTWYVISCDRLRDIWNRSIEPTLQIEFEELTHSSFTGILKLDKARPKREKEFVGILTRRIVKAQSLGLYQMHGYSPEQLSKFVRKQLRFSFSLLVGMPHKPSEDTAQIKIYIGSGFNIYRTRFTRYPGISFTCLHSSAENANLDSIKLLLERGCDINVPDSYGRPPLYYCCYRPYSEWNLDKIKECLLYLIDHGAKYVDIKVCDDHPPQYKDKDDEVNSTILHLFARLGNIPLAECVLPLIPVNYNDDYKRTPLHEASENHKIKMIEWLLSKGADVNSIDHKGNTPLNMYMSNYSSNKVKVCKDVLKFIESGAKPDIANDERKTPLYYAIIWELQECLDIILPHTSIEKELERGVPLLEGAAFHEKNIELVKDLVLNYKASGKPEALLEAIRYHKSPEIFQFLLNQGLLPVETTFTN
jgi:ankyrin repeat protein